MKKENKSIAIIGGGLVGCVQALFLAKRGYKVTVIERRGDPRKADLYAGKSINLALSHRGLTALAKLGLDKIALEISTPMRGRMMHNNQGELTFQPYGINNEAIYSIGRIELNKVLVEAAENHGNIDFLFNHKVKHVNIYDKEIFAYNQDAEQNWSSKYDVIFGSDGAYSVVRQAVMKSQRFNFSQDYLGHGYKELSIPAKNGKHQLDPNALHIWPRGKYMLIALANIDGSFTCTLFMSFEGDPSFSQIQTEQDVEKFFIANFPDVLTLMPDLRKDFFDNPTSSLITIKCSPWHYKNNVMLIGDASHAIVPFYGQGMNSGFEDCNEFDKMLGRYNDELSEEMFNDFSRTRIPNTNAIADMAVENYLEMRDGTANPMFLLRKKIERKMASKYPDQWVPQYSLVTFSNASYIKAQALGKKQAAIMDKIMLHSKIEEIWDSPEIEQEILELVSST